VNKKIARKLDQGPFPRRWLRVAEAAAYMNQSAKSFYNCLARRQIPYSKVKGIGIRVDRVLLDELFVRNQKLPR